MNMEKQTYTIRPLIWNVPDPHGGMDSCAPINLGHYRIFKIKGKHNKYGVQHNGCLVSTGYLGVYAAINKAQQDYEHNLRECLIEFTA